VDHDASVQEIEHMSTTTTTFVATDPAGYERFMGRWSQRLAPSFVEFAGVQTGEQVLDVGCGTGSLTLALAAVGVAAAVGVDPSSPYVEFARTRTASPAVRFDVGDGSRLPYGDGTFDRSVSMLVLDVVPDPVPVVAEMRRVTRPGGTVAGLVNDFRCGYPAFTMLWDTAAVLDPGFGQLSDERPAFEHGERALCRNDPSQTKSASRQQRSELGLGTLAPADAVQHVEIAEV
jgi:ubiquinone/menaquinone biosynthesis C-methylase UbiE